MFSCHFNSPSVCKTMLTGRQRIPARANARGGSRQVSSGCGRRKAWLTCAQDRGNSCHPSATRQCLQDRKHVVWGTSVSVRVDFSGSRLIKKKKKQKLEE